MASNLLNYNVNTMSLARTYWGIPSSSFEMGAIPPSPVGFASGCRGSIASHLSGLRWFLFFLFFMRYVALTSRPVVPFGQSLAKRSSYLFLSLFHFFGILRVPVSLS